MGENQVVKHVPCETTKEFIEAISPIGEHFKSTDDVWIYRGHGDDNYKLVPSAFRIEKIKELYELVGSQRFYDQYHNNSLGQCFVEVRIIRLFLEEADASGLALHEDSQSLRGELENIYTQLMLPQFAENFNPMPINWPIHAIYSIMALAQHHGLPTRLLDWSRSAYTAAYFAAKDVCKKENNSKFIAIWALLANEHNLHTTPFVQTSRNTQCIPEIISVPRYSNPNLHAQEGVFTLFYSLNHSSAKPVDRRSIDEIFNEAVQNGSPFNQTPLIHFTLPSSEAGKVLWYLNKMGVNAAKLFPGFDGAARAVREQLLHQKPENP